MPGTVGKLWIGGTLCLIAFISYSSQLFIILPLLDDPFSARSLQLLLPFNALVALVFYNYYLCINTDPGRVPKGWEPRLGAGEDGPVEVKKLTGGPRYCRTCRAYKPPRAHHCRQCKRCVLKMDHHCPWVDNCVGYHNYGHFVRFLFYVDAACAYHIWLISKRVFGEFAYGPEPQTRELIFLILNYTACLPVLLAVGVFSLYHFWCLLGNTTTIEGWEKDKIAVLRRKGRIQEFKFPYSLGPIQNLSSVLGSNPLLWCLPQRITGDGLSFPTSADVDPHSQYRWPPRDHYARPSRAHRSSRKRMTRQQDAFTYGTALNPDLVPSNQEVLYRRLKERERDQLEAEYTWSTGREAKARPTKAEVSPYHPDYNPPSPSASSSGESDSARQANGHFGSSSSRSDSESSDDRPLGEAMQRRAVRTRKGSEGFEVRPVNVQAVGWFDHREAMIRRYEEERVGAVPTGYVGVDFGDDGDEGRGGEEGGEDDDESTESGEAWQWRGGNWSD